MCVGVCMQEREGGKEEGLCDWKQLLSKHPQVGRE